MKHRGTLSVVPLHPDLHITQLDQRPAYARTNKEEYFSELSEAYFGKNDYYPFIRGELEKHDLMGYRLMRDTWGEPRE